MKKFKKVFAVLLLMLTRYSTGGYSSHTAGYGRGSSQEKNQTEKSQRQVLRLRKRKESLQQMAYH